MSPDATDLAGEMTPHEEVIGFDMDKLYEEGLSNDEKNSNLTNKKENKNVESAAGNTEQDKSAQNDVSPFAGGFFNESGSGERNGRPVLQKPGKENTDKGASNSGSGDLGGSLSLFGEDYDSELRKKDTKHGTDVGIAGNNVSGGSGRNSSKRPLARPRPEERSSTPSKGVKENASKNVIHSDLSNIKEVLPELYEEQQHDVEKAEKRFFTGAGEKKETGRGILFTNATGTGKTFTGLGIIKRFYLDDKKKILIVTPADVNKNDWKEAGEILGLKINILKDTKAPRKGQLLILRTQTKTKDTH